MFRTVRLSRKGLVFITLLLLALSPDSLSDILKINRSIRSLLVRTVKYRTVHVLVKLLLQYKIFDVKIKSLGTPQQEVNTSHLANKLGS